MTMTVSLCKPPESISFTGNAVCNWQEFEEQLKHLLRETDISLNKMVGLAQRTESSKQHIKEMAGATTKLIDASYPCGQ